MSRGLCKGASSDRPVGLRSGARGAVTEPLAAAIVRQILDDPELVIELRRALLDDGSASGRIDHRTAAARWGVTPATVTAWCREGKIDGTKVGRTWLVDPDAERPRRAPSTPQVAAAPPRTSRRPPARARAGKQRDRVGARMGAK